MRRNQQESYRNMYLGVGFLIAMSVTISAFEWESIEHFIPLKSSQIGGEFPEFVPPTDIPEPPKPKKIIIPENLVETPEPEVELEDIFETLDQSSFDIPDFIEVETPPTEVAPDIIDVAEIMPEPSEGYTSFYQKLGKEINYPRKAKSLGVEGRVFVQYIVDRDGGISDIKVIKGIGAGCDEEAVRALKVVGSKWKPGKQRGVPVKVRMVIPIIFELN